MKHILFVGIAMMALVGCDIPGLGNERPGSDGDARATAGEATELVDAMAAHNRLPQRMLRHALGRGGEAEKR